MSYWEGLRLDVVLALLAVGLGEQALLPPDNLPEAVVSAQLMVTGEETEAMTAFFVGLDLGQAHDSTAVALLAREVVRRQRCYALRHLQRWPPGTPYPRIAEEVRRLFRVPGLRPCRMVMDQTGVGRAVADLFRPADVSTRRVLISAGHAVTCGEDQCTHVPKKELVSVLQVLLQTQRLRVAAGLPLAEELSRDMVAFRANVQVAGAKEEVSWRQREHDDLVLAVALAAWEGERNLPSIGMPLIVGDPSWRALGHGW